MTQPDNPCLVIKRSHYNILFSTWNIAISFQFFFSIFFFLQNIRFAGWQGSRCYEDIDECTKGIPISCSTEHTRECVNTIGSYKCACKQGAFENASFYFRSSCGLIAKYFWIRSFPLRREQSRGQDLTKGGGVVTAWSTILQRAWIYGRINQYIKVVHQTCSSQLTLLKRLFTNPWNVMNRQRPNSWAVNIWVRETIYFRTWHSRSMKGRTWDLSNMIYLLMFPTSKSLRFLSSFARWAIYSITQRNANLS